MPTTICKNCKNKIKFDRTTGVFDSVDYECPYFGKTFWTIGIPNGGQIVWLCTSIFVLCGFIFIAIVVISDWDNFVDVRKTYNTHIKPVVKNEISEIVGGEEKNNLYHNPYLYEDGFFVSYQKKYDTLWAWCKMMGPRKIGTLRSEYSTRVVYEEAFKKHYSPQKSTNDVWIARLKNSIRNMKPDSSEQQQHSAMVDLANTFIAADNLLNSEVSASTFLYELNSIEKNYVEALRKVELNISPE